MFVFINLIPQGEIPLLYASKLQVETTQNSQYSDIDKFVWKAEILSLAEITNL